ncbi:MAG TPA: class I SAM-dependent methyltransferase [Candidatus Solibacter sp.]|nr:class I SAM-dependent methyltransferase [Candidatus Solibacter sp.]
MAVTQPSIYSAPFDAIATRYDETFTSSLIGQAQRAAVWRELEKTFQAGDRVLEIGCGTGVDACFLAERGVEVFACDSSAEMITQAERRIRDRGLRSLVHPRQLRAEEIVSLATGRPYDGAFSNFGVLNCLENLAEVGRMLAGLMKPEATCLLCWMGPLCLWEMGWYLAHGNRSKAFRRLKREGVDARLADGALVHVRYPSVKAVAHAFGPHFRLRSIKGIGIAIPPSYLEGWARRRPGWLRVGERADSLLALCPGIRLMGDHVLARLQRVPLSQATQSK